MSDSFIEYFPRCEMQKRSIFCDLYTIDSFATGVMFKLFKDGEGYCMWSLIDRYPQNIHNIMRPSKFQKHLESKPSWATHVIWVRYRT